MGKDNKENKTLYINLIDMILQNIKDMNAIKRIYDFAQTLWYDEKAHDPGG